MGVIRFIFHFSCSTNSYSLDLRKETCVAVANLGRMKHQQKNRIEDRTFLYSSCGYRKCMFVNSLIEEEEKLRSPEETDVNEVYVRIP